MGKESPFIQDSNSDESTRADDIITKTKHDKTVCIIYETHCSAASVNKM